MNETKRYGLLGAKLGHSFSKEIHEMLADYTYELIELDEAALDRFLHERAFAAVNVTIPYKQTVIPYLDELSETASRIGAVNTVVNRGGKLYGDNTDFYGMRALICHAGVDLSGKKVLIGGTGGTARTALAVCESLGAHEIYTVSRSGRDGALTYEAAATEHGDADVLLNTTPCGMYPDVDGVPFDLFAYPRLSGVIDAVYNPLRTRLVMAARERGIPAEGGLYMLVAQAVAAVERFLDTRAPEAETERVYRQVFDARENIVLTGMPGSGKSTIGKLLSEQTGRPFYDTDAMIVEDTGKTIPELFAERGESGFRDAESAAIRRASALTGAIIATGGGAVLREENVRALRQNGRITLIDRPLEFLLPTEDRPLASTVEHMENLYRVRAPIYAATADTMLKATNDAEENARLILDERKDGASV